MIPGMTTTLSNNQLQATIAAATSSNESISPHHPITCAGDIFYDEDGTFSCEHASTPPDNIRSQQCVTHSIALLLIDLAREL